MGAQIGWEILSRLIRLFRRDVSSNKPVGVCLLFHRVAEIEDNTVGPYQQLSIAPNVFEQIIAHVSEKFNPISVPELLGRLHAQQPLPEGAIAVTFDDGFSDTWAVAYPILAKYGVPATIYITTGFIDGTAYPYEFELASWIESQSQIHLEWDGYKYHWELHDRADQETCYREIKELTEPMSSSERTELLSRMTEGTAVPTTDSDLFMRWDQLRELVDDPLITVGAHTDSHPLLTLLSSREALRDIETGKRKLERRLGQRVQHFSYPYGAYDAHTKQLVRACGFESAVTTTPRGINLENVDVMAIPRLEIREEAQISARTLHGLVKQCNGS